MPRRVVLIDDNRAFLDSAANFLRAEPEIEVAAKFCSVHEALERVPDLNADLVLMDLSMPAMNGLEATRLMKEQDPRPRVIILTLYDDPAYRAAAAEVQADGFIAKSDLGRELLPLIRDLFSSPGTRRAV